MSGRSILAAYTCFKVAMRVAIARRSVPGMPLRRRSLIILKRSNSNIAGLYKGDLLTSVNAPELKNVGILDAPAK
jgi:hypothetical protein